MKKIFLAAAMLFAVSLGLAQEKRDSVKTEIPAKNIRLLPDINLPSFELYHDLYFDNVPVNVDSNTIWLWTSYSLSGGGTHHYLPGAPEPHMLANFHDMYIEDTKFSMVKQILAAAQLGAVGYLAYKSIQKYGFWDNK